MTYCLGMNLDAGMVFVSDSRTNAGIDNVSRFEKMRTFSVDGERLVVTLSAGNLSVTQNALSLLEQRHRADPAAPSLWNAPSMLDVVGLIGSAMREIQQRDGEFMRQNNIDASASFIVGGQIAGEDQRMFLVYSEGNFIESSGATCYFQIGEIKYGKPIVDRVLDRGTPLMDAVKCALVSFDSTMRSNVSVGPPLDVLVYEAGSLRTRGIVSLDDNDPYFRQIHELWSDGVKRLFSELPAPAWGSDPD